MDFEEKPALRGFNFQVIKKENARLNFDYSTQPG